MKKLSLYQYFFILNTIPLALSASINTPEAIDRAAQKAQRKTDEPKSILKYAPAQSPKAKKRNLREQIARITKEVNNLKKRKKNKEKAIRNIEKRIIKLQKKVQLSTPQYRDIQNLKKEVEELKKKTKTDKKRR